MVCQRINSVRQITVTIAAIKVLKDSVRSIERVEIAQSAANINRLSMTRYTRRG